MVSLRLLADSLLRHIAKTDPSVTSSSCWLAAECHIQSMPPSYYFVDASILMLHLRLISRLLNPLPCLPLVPLTVFSLLIHPSVFSFAVLTLSLIFANYSFITMCETSKPFKHLMTWAQCCTCLYFMASCTGIQSRSIASRSPPGHSSL